MATSVRALFDGEVLRLQQPTDLRRNTTYVITIEEEVPTEAGSPVEEPYALTEIGRLATDMGVTDLAARHDWYAHGRLEDPTDEQRDE